MAQPNIDSSVMESDANMFSNQMAEKVHFDSQVDKIQPLGKSENVDEVVNLTNKLLTPKKLSDMKKASKETFFGTKKKRNKSNSSWKSSHKEDYQQDQPPPMKTVADELFREDAYAKRYST